MRIGLLGTGNVARALAQGWSAAGHDVLLGSRDPKQRTGLDLPVASLDETAAHAEVLVNATPGGVSVELLRPYRTPAELPCDAGKFRGSRTPALRGVRRRTRG